MLPNSRSDSVTGRRKMFERNSIGVSMIRTHHGTSGGHVETRR